jgi:hypothetical protein
MVDNKPSSASQAQFQHFDSRLSRLEAVVESLTGDIRSVSNAVKDLSSSYQASSKTPWNVLIGWSGILLTIMTLIFTPITWLILDTRSAIVQHRNITGHPGAMERHASHEERFLRAFSDITNLETRLQREMTIQDNSILGLLEALDKEVKGISLWQKQNNVSNTATIHRLDERTSVLERETLK